MSLTPIHVRGKRKSPAHKPSPIQQTPKARRSIQDVKVSRHTRPQRASLETLPQEILDSILLYSCNVALPRSSLVIGAKLSGRATLIRLFIWVFHETWDQWFGIPTSSKTFHGPYAAADSNEFPSGGDPQFQTALLSLPWANIDFILQAQQTWVDHYARGRWYQHSVPWLDITIAPPHHSHEGGYGHFNARACFEADYAQFKQWRPFRAEQLAWTAQDVHPGARLPTSLLTGPWDQEKLQRLFWLCRGGIGRDLESDLHSQPDRKAPLPLWEDRLECLRNAVLDVSEPNVQVANCLLHGWLFTDLPEDVVRREVYKLEKRIEWGYDDEDGMVILRRTREALSFHLELPKFLG